MARADATAILLVACAASACAAARVDRPYAWVRNGGIGPRAATCDDVGLRIDDVSVRALAAPSDACGTRDAALASDVGAAYAFVRTSTSATVVGPIVSNEIALGIVGLTGGSGERGLAAGGGERELASGAGERALASGAGERGLASGGGERGLASGAGERGLASGAGERGLTSGAGERAVDAGASERALAAGARERPPFSLRKAVAPDAIAAGEPAEFTLTFVNDGPAAIERLVIVDRVPPALRVESAGGARAYELADGSTLLVWDDRGVVAPRDRRAVSFRAVIRGASP